jgi:hypothetical protein
MIATIAVRAKAAATEPGAGSVVNVTAQSTAVRTTQAKPRSLDADLMVVAFDMDRLGAPNRPE